MQKPRKRFLSAIVAVAMCLSQFAPVTAYAVESASGITQSEEAPKETDALSTTTTNSDSSATTPAPKSDVTDTASSASSDTSVTSDVSSEATSQAGSETTTAYANSAASDTGASTSTSSEASTTGSISEAAQAFIDAANALVSRKDEILTAANNFGLASKAWQADKENAVLDAMVTRRTEELDAVYDWEPIEDMYYSLSEDEQVAEPVMNAYLDMSDLYLQVCDRQENPVDNSGASAFDGGGSTTVIGDYQAITAAETGKQIAAGTGIQYTKISGQENVIRILPQTVTYTYGDSFKSKGLTIEYSTADSRTSQEVEKDIQAAIDGLSFIMYAPADGDGQNPTDIHCNAGTYPTYVDTGATSVTVNGLNYTIIDGSNLDSSKNIRNDTGVTIKPVKVTFTVAGGYSMIYGGTVPTFSYTVTGLKNNDTVASAFTGSVVYNIKNADGSLSEIPARPAAGDYVITMSGLENKGAKNYDPIVFVDGSLHVDKRDVIVVVDEGQKKVYGEADPALTWTATGDGAYYVSEDAGDLANLKVVRPDAGTDAGEDVGKHPMIIEGDDVNFNITRVNNTFEITPATLNVTLAPQSKIYGDENPVLSGDDLIFDGFVVKPVKGNTTPDDAGVLSIANLTFNFTDAEGAPATVASHAGTGKVVPANVENAAANNYSIDSYDFRKNQGRLQNILFHLYGRWFCYDARKYRASH